MNRRARPERPGRLTLDKVETPRDLVLWAEARFEGAGLSYGHGTTSAREEAVFLVFHALALPFDVPDAVLDRPLSRKQNRVRWRSSASASVPASPPPMSSASRGLRGSSSMSTSACWCRDRRSPSSSKRASPRGSSDPRRILDIGTGSGCIAIACALAFPEAEVDATDISAGALEIASRNAERHGVRDRVRLLRSDVYESLAGERYDLIVSNPPYVPAAHLATLPPEHRHEPSLGLDGGDDGLAIVSRILEGATEHLSEHGTLVVEAGESATALEARYPRVPFVWLEFERGGEGVFLLEARELRRCFPGGNSQ